MAHLKKNCDNSASHVAQLPIIRHENPGSANERVTVHTVKAPTRGDISRAEPSDAERNRVARWLSRDLSPPFATVSTGSSGVTSTEVER
jgi:hypothetical protein